MLPLLSYRNELKNGKILSDISQRQNQVCIIQMKQ